MSIVHVTERIGDPGRYCPVCGGWYYGYIHNCNGGSAGYYAICGICGQSYNSREGHVCPGAPMPVGDPFPIPQPGDIRPPTITPSAPDEPPKFKISFDKKPYRCPVCNGTSLVSRPPHVAGDVDTWTSDTTGPYKCKACENGVIWK